MENLHDLIDAAGLENKLRLEDIPSIDLYMDQVIQLFENIFADTKPNKDEKVLTKTMINNYAKGKLLFPIKNKKYSKEHLILISLIYQLKGALSLNDIKATLAGINRKIVEENFRIDSFYHSYLHLIDKNLEEFKENIQTLANHVNEEVTAIDEKDSQNIERILMIVSLVHKSNLYRKIAEKLVDGILEEDNEKNRK